MNSKKSETFLTGHVMNLLLAVMVILVLIYLAVRLISIYYNQDVRRAADILTVIDQKISYFTGGSYTGNEMKFLVYPPKEGDWFLVSFERSFFPEKECVGRYEKCLCICQGVDCKPSSLGPISTCTHVTCPGAKACKGFNGISVEGDYISSMTAKYPEDPVKISTDYPNTFEILGQSQELKLTKSNEETKISAVR
ncbi:hypothetical protein A3K73_00095 [Candidatus Pacearchaeota archaeon RBG_13_36_9]|nr:MAG: hypothetical protein A3K73_00095 [Candidatus Pacearchaeota archaeon RBG_13_36_9]